MAGMGAGLLCKGGVCLHWYDWLNAIGYYCNDMQSVVVWNFFGSVDVDRSRFILLV